MIFSKQPRQQFLSLVLTLCCLATVAAIVYFAGFYSIQTDITYNAKNTLSKATRDTLKQLQGPVRIVAYATPQDPKIGDVRKFIRDFVTPYQRAKPDLSLQFIDPREHPKLSAEADIKTNGEMVVTFGDRSEHLSTLNEQAFTNVLIRLARAQKRLVLYLEGHGERKLVFLGTSCAIVRLTLLIWKPVADN